MANAVLLQAATTLIVAVLAGLIGGKDAGWSAMLGGLACTVPNALFALRLFVGSRRADATVLGSVVGLFVGEFAKLAATAVLLILIARFYRGLDWLALIIGVIAVVHGFIFTFLLERRRG